MNPRWPGALAALCFCTPSFADSLDKDRIPADAQWLVHVDLSGLKGSRVFRDFLQGEMELEVEMQEVREELGIDPLQDVFGITAFGTDDSEEHAVVLLHVSESLAAQVARLGEIPGYRATSYGGYAMHELPDDEHTICGALRELPDGTSVAVIGREPERVARVLDVIRGRAESLADSGSNLAATLRSGTMIHASAQMSFARLAEIEPLSRVARLAQGLEVSLGESGPNLFLGLSVEAQSEEDATRIQQVLQGATALFSLWSMQEELDEDLQVARDLLGGLRFASRDKRMTVELEFPLEELTRQIGNRRPGRKSAGPY